MKSWLLIACSFFSLSVYPFTTGFGLGEDLTFSQLSGVLTVSCFDHSNSEHALFRCRGTSVEPSRYSYFYGPKDMENRAGVISFNIKGVHAHDAATMLDEQGIAIRAGHHCAGPLMERLGVPATCRVSFGVYNTLEEIDVLIKALREVVNRFK